MSPSSGRLSPSIAIVINEASSEGLIEEYPITVHKCTKTALFVTAANMSVITNIFQLITAKAQTVKMKYM